MKNKFVVMPIVAAAYLLPGAPAEAVVYCKTRGVPKGCVMRPAPAAAVVVTPRAPARAVVRTPVNRGGPVNRVGVR